VGKSYSYLKACDNIIFQQIDFRNRYNFSSTPFRKIANENIIVSNVRYDTAVVRGPRLERPNDEFQFQLNIIPFYHNICSVEIIRDCFWFSGAHCKNNNRASSRSVLSLSFSHIRLLLSNHSIFKMCWKR
jgi:hypothetical protein